MMQPRVTIVITNFNYQKFIGSAISSALKQDYECNVCVVDDGSTDNSWEFIKLFFRNCCSSIDEIDEDGTISLKNNNLTAYRTPNGGASKARNFAIEKTLDDTDVFAILDGDDEYYENKVSTLLLPLVQHKEVGVTYSDYMIHKTYNGLDYTKYEAKEPYSKERLLRSCIVHSGALIKKSYLEQVRLPNGEFYDSRLHGPGSKPFIGCTEDYDLWLRLSNVCTMVHIAEPLSLVRESGANQSFKMTPQIFEQNAQVIRSRF